MDSLPFEQPVSEGIWIQKYCFDSQRENIIPDLTVRDTWARIAEACADVHPEDKLFDSFYYALEDFKFLPAGRIIAGAGTGRKVTLFNCYVMGTIPDSLDGIFSHLKEAALTMQQGGGIGYDFSTLRPEGALVRGVEAPSSGPLSFMDVWNWMCKTIMSAGSRRGAMMATMRCDHPDIMKFVEAKKDPSRLRHFNVSVLCTDEFMEAVEHNSPWELTFEGKVYNTIQARDLWNHIMENTYSHAEPGVIFIDRINKMNNLWFVEQIAATNPCGEQPLPPYGACLLGSINLTKFILDEFSDYVAIDYDELETITRSAVRMLDCVIDSSNFPLSQQEQEAYFKRRMGLGITGLADALFMLGVRYGSNEAVTLTEEIMSFITRIAYEESVVMAKEWGPAPVFVLDPRAKDLFSKSQFLASVFNKEKDQELLNDIMVYGIRNCLLTSIAPTGTISLYANNVSSGIEPIFAAHYTRKITNDDGTKREENVYSYSVNKYLFEQGLNENDSWWRDYMVTAQDLTPIQHLRMQAAAQKYVDSSISKTINLPKEIEFQDFEHVYWEAYKSGCKGCTTYRPNDVTGSILSVEEPEPEMKDEPKKPDPLKEPEDMRIMNRPDILDGRTYKLRWDGTAYYVTFTHAYVGTETVPVPFEIFIASKNPEHQAWIGALTRMISAVFQRGGDIRFVFEEMKSVYDPRGGSWHNGSYYPSLVALIGETLKEYLYDINYLETEENHPFSEAEIDTATLKPSKNNCPSCFGFNVVTLSGCPTCLDCGYSKCS